MINREGKAKQANGVEHEDKPSSTLSLSSHHQPVCLLPSSRRLARVSSHAVLVPVMYLL